MLLPICTWAQNGVYYIPSAREVDSVDLLLPRTANDTLKMSMYFYLSAYYTELNKDSSLYFGDLQLTLAQKLHQKLWEADALFQIGYLSFGLGNYPKSFSAVTRGLTIAEDKESEINNWRVATLSVNGNPHTARLFIWSALLQQLAFLYENVGDVPNAISNYLTAMKIAESVDNKIELSLDNMSLGYDYIRLNKLDSALIVENKAQVYAVQSNYQIYLGTILESIGDIHFLKNNYDSAGKYYRDAMNASIAQNNLKDEINSFLAIAKLKRTRGKLDSSLFYARKALLTSRIFVMPTEISRAYNSIFSAYRLMGNTDSAYAYLQLAKSLDDSLNDSQRDKTNQYQSLNLNAQMRLQETEKSKIQFEDKIRAEVMLASIGILMLIAFLLYKNNRNRKKANILLKTQKEQIEQQKRNIELALTEIKSTQSQLIHSEKMASLGELTAGIAHEIQNPLNFVNNFSDVNKELLVELKDEIKKGNFEDVSAIANNVISNEEKINHHGKRADAIVKGMLQHSRSNTGLKQPTDIHALADEYLRLSYHGSRAKDNSFNALMKTNYDPAIGLINIIPQDIGRVLLNLFNNAFYAVSEKSKQQIEGYEPTVSVSSKKLGDKVELCIKDNGNGIPQKIVGKIFQPFFTTKPTGQGTGLGLSLSYDIIKAHRGEIIVETNEKEGSDFIIGLPLN